LCECGAEKVLGYGVIGRWDCPVCWELGQAEREAAEREAEMLRISRKGISARYLDADFANCDSRITAVAAVKRWVDNPTGIILISGKCGCGKTYLASAAKKEFNRRRQNCRLVYEDVIFSEIKSTFSGEAKETEREVYARYTAPYPLIIDDVGIERPTDNGFTVSVWEKIIGARYRENMPTMMTSNYVIYNKPRGELTEDEKRGSLAARVGHRVEERIRESKQFYVYESGKNWRR